MLTKSITVFSYIVLCYNFIESHLVTPNNQFGFKQKFLLTRVHLALSFQKKI